MNIFLALLTLAVATTVSAQNSESASATSSVTAIRSILQNQVDAWNRGDLDAFLEGYWKSPELTFFGARETHGWQATVERYHRTYQSEGHSMGSLKMNDLRIEMLGPEAAFVRGGWQLTMPDGKQPHGLFTLVLRRFPQGWRIVHDHTSSE